MSLKAKEVVRRGWINWGGENGEGKKTANARSAGGTHLHRGNKKKPKRSVKQKKKVPVRDTRRRRYVHILKTRITQSCPPKQPKKRDPVKNRKNTRNPADKLRPVTTINSGNNTVTKKKITSRAKYPQTTCK